MHNLWKDQDRKVHFKMYKSGKHWVFAGLAVIGLSVGLGISGGNVRADSHEDGSVPQTEDANPAQTVITDKQPGEPVNAKVSHPDSEDENHSQSVKVETSPAQPTGKTGEKSATDVNASKVAGQTTTEQSTNSRDEKPVNGTYTNEIDPKINDDKSVSAPVNQLSDANPQTVQNSDAKQNLKTKTVSNPPVESKAPVNPSESKTAADQENHSDESDTVIVKPKNFKDYFQVNNHASWDGKTLTLTTDHHQSGNATLKTKIDMLNSFQLKGSVMLGDWQYPATEWADGISFGFHSGDVNAHGGDGADMGMGGLPDGFGFKLDTYANTDQGDPKRFTYTPHFHGLQETQAFGAFAYNDKSKQGSPSETYNPSKLSAPDAPKALAAGDANSLQPNHFYPVEIDYDGKTHDMTAIFDNDVAGHKITWHHNVSQWSENKKALSFFLAASTGQYGGLQQFKFDSFRYTVPSVVNVKFMDEDGSTIPNAPQPLTIYGKPGQKVDLTGVTADIQKIESNGQYYFDRVDKKETGDFDVAKNQLTMSKQTQDITYYFAKSQAKITANNFTIYAGQPWTSDLKNVTAVAKNGQAIDPSDLLVTADGNNEKPGTYNVTYTLSQHGYHGGTVQSVKKTVKATVIENKSKIETKDVSYQVGDKYDPANSLVSAVDGQGKPASLDSGAITSYVSDANGHPVTQDAVITHSGDYYLQFSYKNGQQVLSKSKRSKITVVQPNNITVDLVDPNSDQEWSILPKDHQTGDQIDVAPSSEYLTSIIPAGYHYAKADELPTNETQPTVNPVYSGKQQTVKVYVVGNSVDKNAANALTVHHYLKDSADVKVAPDKSIGGRIGEKVVAKVADASHAAEGYTLVPNQKDQTATLTLNHGDQAKFYYTADPQDNIKVNVLNAANVDIVKVTKPQGHHTGDVLDVSPNSSFLDIAKERGYHYAVGDELNGHIQPLKNPTYSAKPQEVNIYVAGDTITDKMANSLLIHYFKNDTTTSVKPERRVGGIVGSTVTLKLNDKEQQVPGYELVSPKQDVNWTLNNAVGQEQNFYYKPTEQKNISVHFMNIRTDRPIGNPDQPLGHTNETLNLSETSNQIDVPEGYHWATRKELDKYQKQQTKELKWETQKQDAKVYVAGNPIDANSKNALTVNYYLQDDHGLKTETAIRQADKIGGNVGDQVTVSPQSKDNQIDGYTMVGKQKFTRTLGTSPIDPVNLYYTANRQNNITVEVVDVNGKPHTFVTTETPTGKTGQKLDLIHNVNIPEGYHLATIEELRQHNATQPDNPTYKTNSQKTTVYVAGNEAKNAVTVRYYLKDEQGRPTKKEIADASQIGTQVGQAVTFDPNKDPKKIDGYTLVSNQTPEVVEIHSDTKQEIPVYYTGDKNNKITVHFIDPQNGGTTVQTEKPEGHTGSVLNLDDDNQIQIPAGYHRLNPADIPNGQKRVANPIYSTKDQNVAIYITGNPIDSNDANALTINHYLQDASGQQTKREIGSSRRLGGQVGQVITIDPQDSDNQIPGYTAVGKSPISRTLGVKAGRPIDLYYTANDVHNMTVHEFDVNGNHRDPIHTAIPNGKTGDPLKLADNSNLTIPVGYHIATPDELKAAKVSQPTDLRYTATPKTVSVYIAGNKAKNAVITRYYLQDENGNQTKTIIAPDKSYDGTVGQDISVDPAVIDGYTIVSDQGKMAFEVTPNMHKVVPIFYKGNENKTISVHLIDPNDHNHIIQTEKPTGHTGGTLNLSDNSKIVVPDGYHIVDQKDLNGKKQPANPTYTTKDQDVDVYITGNVIDPNADNAVTVHHYLSGTLNPVIPDTKVGGRVGQTVSIDPKAADNQITGYTPDANQSIQQRTLGTVPVADATIYYTPNVAQNITIKYVDANTGKVIGSTTPKGYFGGKVDLNNNATVKIPTGYHRAASNDLPRGKQQAQGNLTFTDKDQSVVVYVFKDYSGNNDGSSESNVVTQTPSTKPEQPIASKPANQAVKVPVSNNNVPRNTIKKGEVVYSLKKIYLYKNKTFSKKERIAYYVKKPCVYRPMFVVIGHSYSKNGLLRYKVRDVNHLTKNRHLVGYMTANAKYVQPVYYHVTHRTVTVINPLGVNSYRGKDLSGKVRKYKQGVVLHVVKVVHHHLTTRYVLTNGRYVTANRKLVIVGNKKMPRTIRVKKTINQYKNVNFTQRNKQHFQRGTKLRILGYDYSHANNVLNHGTLRYRVAGGYVTGNSKFVKVYY